MNTSAWVALAVLVGVALCLALLSLQAWRRMDSAQRERQRAVREQETLSLARRMWMSGGE